MSINTFILSHTDTHTVCALKQRHDNREVAAGRCCDLPGLQVLSSSWHLFQESLLLPSATAEALTGKMTEKEVFRQHKLPLDTLTGSLFALKVLKITFIQL